MNMLPMRRLFLYRTATDEADISEPSFEYTSVTSGRSPESLTFKICVVIKIDSTDVRIYRFNDNSQSLTYDRTNHTVKDSNDGVAHICGDHLTALVIPKYCLENQKKSNQISNQITIYCNRKGITILKS